MPKYVIFSSNHLHLTAIAVQAASGGPKAKKIDQENAEISCYFSRSKLTTDSQVNEPTEHGACWAK